LVKQSDQVAKGRLPLSRDVCAYLLGDAVQELQREGLDLEADLYVSE
jgi:hypothetical protein